MDFEIITNSVYFTYIVLPILIFLARIFDQSIGILRILFATKGLKLPAFIAGFFESLVWLVAISSIINQLDNVFCYIAFSGGFATGNAVGIYLEQKISIGFVMIRVVFQKNAEETIKLLKSSDFKLTISDAMGMHEPVKMVFSTIKRKDLKEFLKILKLNNPTAFYTIEDVKMVKEGYLHKKAYVMNRRIK